MNRKDKQTLQLQAQGGTGVAWTGLTLCHLILLAAATPKGLSGLHLQRFHPLSIDSRAIVAAASSHQWQHKRVLATGIAPAASEFVSVNSIYFQVLYVAGLCITYTEDADGLLHNDICEC